VVARGGPKSYDSKIRRNSRIEGVTGEQSSLLFQEPWMKARLRVTLLSKKGDKIKEENLLLPFI
jgi:hypothetical protein